MKFHSAAAVAACLLLGDVSSVFGEGDGQIKLQKTETVERDLLSTETERDLGSREQEDLWSHILDSQLSISPTPGPTRPIRPPTNRPTPRPTNRPTFRPTTRPTFRPTDNPTTLPPVVPDDEECELQMDIKCVVPMGSISVPCQDVRDPEDEPECRKPVDFIYKIANVCDPSLNPFCDSATIDRFDRVRNGELKDLMYTVKAGSDQLAPLAKVVVHERGVEFDFCKNKTVDTNAIITANTAPGFSVGVCAAEASNFFTIGFAPDLKCKVAIDLTCFIVDDQGTRTNCRDVPMPRDDDECIKEVTYAYIVTNVNSVPKTIIALDRTREGESLDLLGFLDRYEIPPGQYGVARETDRINFCIPKIIKTETFVTSEAFGVGDLDCSDSIVHSFPINIICDVDVKLECFADEDSGFRVPCDSFNPFFSGKKGCEHALKFVYTITNSGPGPEAVTAITVTRDGKEKNVLDKQFKLEPDEVKQHVEVMLVNYCEDFPEGMNTKVEVEAKMVPEGGACSAVDDFTLQLPTAPCDMNIDPYIKCTLEVFGREVSCLDYIKGIDDKDDPSQCIRDVKYEVTLINQGLACLEVYSVTGEVEGRAPVDITPEGNISVCPNKKFVVVHRNRQNLCDDDLESEIVIKVNGGPPETCGGFGSLTYIPPPATIEHCQVELSLSCTDKFGDACEVARGQQECDSPPTYLDLKFTGKPCSASDNDLGQLFTCNDFDPMLDLTGAYVSIQSKDGEKYFGATVAKGSTIRIGNQYNTLARDLVVNVQTGKNGSLLQRLQFHSSCEKAISTRDVFGSLTLLGFGDREKEILATDNEFDIGYEIRNVGAYTALLEEILLSANNALLSKVYLQLFQLKAGDSYKGSETVEISTQGDSVSVLGELMAESLSAIRCNTQDTLEIDVGDPPTPYPTTSPTYVPTNRPTPEPTEEQQCQCHDHPFAYRFKLIGGTCQDSVNSQKFWCTDNHDVEEWSHIMVTNKDSSKTFFEGNVKIGQYFEVNGDRDDFNGFTIFKIMFKDSKTSDWKLSQAVKFDTSCEKPLFLGDTFGSIEVTGWVNKEQGKVVEGGDNKC